MESRIAVVVGEVEARHGGEEVAPRLYKLSVNKSKENEDQIRVVECRRVSFLKLWLKLCWC